jgi:hypothetical protein
MVKKTKMGKIHVPLDVRDENDVPAFEKMLGNGPMMIVLVYADWCGHCTKYKENVWSPLKSVKNRTMNMASVHYDQLENTSLKNSKIEGYPSLLVVGKDKTPATFKSPSGTTTNSLPKANDFTTMKNLATSPIVENSENEVVLNTLPKISSSLNPSTIETEDRVRMNSVNKNRNRNQEKVLTNSLKTVPKETVLEETVLEETVPEETTPELPMNQSTNQAEETGETVPKISEDVVTLTNSLNKNANPSPFSASTTSTNAVTMMGGRLYRMLSLKKKRRASSKKRKSTRKTAKF